MQSDVKVSVEYFIYYHGHKYFFIEGEIHNDIYGLKYQLKDKFGCVINNKLDSTQKRNTIHRLLKNRGLRIRKGDNHNDKYRTGN